MESDSENDILIAATSTGGQSTPTRVNTPVGSDLKTDKQTWYEGKKSACSVEAPSATTADPSSSSYVAFGKDFHAEALKPRGERFDEAIGNLIIPVDDDSTSDDVTTIHEEVDVSVNTKLGDELEKNEIFVPSMIVKPESESSHFTKSRRRPQSASERRRSNSSEGFVDPNMNFALTSDDVRAMSGPYQKSGLKRYSSTGDLRASGRMSPAARKRLLPDLTSCKRIAKDESGVIDIATMSETLLEPETPGDRKTLEAQFKLLYRENVKLDRAYGELQDKVKSESPRILSSRFLSPRETEWLMEKRALKKEIQHLKQEIEQQEETKLTSKHSDGTAASQLSSGSLSPSSERTEYHIKERLHELRKVKDDEIARLSEQVSYWMNQANNDQSNEAPDNQLHKAQKQADRIAELEQSEARLQCQLINLEDQLVSTKNDLALTRQMNDDLGEHCKKLEDGLAVLDAEKALLDDLKNQNGTLRNQLSSFEDESRTLVDKLAKLADEKGTLEDKLSSLSKSQQANDKTLEAKIKQQDNENKKLKDEYNEYRERCLALESVKDCLTEQIRALEDELKQVSTSSSEKIKKLTNRNSVLQNEKSELMEVKEKYETERELTSNEAENLLKRTCDLQGHIDTLKAQLESHKHKVESFDQVQEELETALSEKTAFEAACERHLEDKKALESQIADQHECLSESFERANMQLMLETNEMATRQRSLLAENQSLRLKSGLRGVDAMIGREVREKLRMAVRSCNEIVGEFQQSSQRRQGREPGADAAFVLERSPGDPAVSRAASASNDLESAEVELVTASLSEAAADEIIDRHVKSADGLAIEELLELQLDSPRLDGVFPLSQLKSDLIASRAFIAAVTNAEKVLRALWSSDESLRTEVNALVAENNRLRNGAKLSEATHDSIDLQQEQRRIPDLSKGGEEARSEVVATRQGDLQQDRDQLIAARDDALHKCVEANAEIESLRNTVSDSKCVEDELQSQLRDVQGMCDQLVIRMQKIQEEKSEMIMASHGRARDVEVLEELREEVGSLRNENSTWRSRAESQEKEWQKIDNERLIEIDNLRCKLQRIRDRESETRKCLDETQAAGEELIVRVKTIQEEKFELLAKSRATESALRRDLDEKDNHLRRVSGELNETKSESASVREQLAALQQRFDSISDSLQEKTDEVVSKEAKLAELERRCRELEAENGELKIKVDEIENEKFESVAENGKEIYVLKDKLKELQTQLEEAASLTDAKESLCQQIRKDLKTSRATVAEKEEKLHTAEKTYESELCTLRYEKQNLAKQVEDVEQNNEKIIRELQEQLLKLGSELEAKSSLAHDQLKREEGSKENLSKDLKDRSTEIERLKNDNSLLSAELKQTRLQLEKSNIAAAERQVLPKEASSEKRHAAQKNDATTQSELLCLTTKAAQLSEENERLRSQLQSNQRKQHLTNATTQTFAEQDKSTFVEAPVAFVAPSRANDTFRADTHTATHDRSADPECLLANTRDSEVKRLENRCSKLEQLLAEKEKQLSILSAVNSTTNRGENAGVSTSSDAEVYELTGSEKTMENLLDFDSDVTSRLTLDSQRNVPDSEVEHSKLKLSDSVESFSSTESKLGARSKISSTLVAGYNQSDILEENKSLRTRLRELEVLLAAYENDDAASSIRKLHEENTKLMSKLDEAAKAVPASLQEQLDLHRSMVTDLRAKLSDSESFNVHSGTESEPEALRQDRATQDNHRHEIEELRVQLEESDNMAIAHKKSLEHVLNLNESLRSANAKLCGECQKLKNKLRLPDHPVIKDVVRRIHKTRMFETSPPSLGTENRTPAGSITETDTLPFDEIVHTLCVDNEDRKEEIERLTTELEDSQTAMQSLERRNRELEQEALELEERLHQSNESLEEKTQTSEELRNLLTMNEANSKKSLESKEESIEHLEKSLEILKSEFSSKERELVELKTEHNKHSDQVQQEIAEMTYRVASLSEELQMKERENIDLLGRTSQLERQSGETQAQLEASQTEVERLLKAKTNVEECREQEVRDLNEQLAAQLQAEKNLNHTLLLKDDEIEKLRVTVNDVTKSSSQYKAVVEQNERSIVSLNSELSEREEQIEVLSSRVDELVETEDALKSTMESADDMIAEREKQHQNEVDQLREGLNKSLTSAKRAEMSSAELQEEITKLERKNSELEGQLEKIRKEDTDFATEIEALEMERELMNTSLINAREDTIEVENKNHELERAVADQNETIEQMQKTVDELNRQVVALRERGDELSVEKSERELEMKRIFDENEKRTKQRNRNDGESTSNREPLTEDQISSHLDPNRLEDELHALQEELARTRKVIGALRMEKRNLEAEVSQLQNDSARGSLVWTETSNDFPHSESYIGAARETNELCDLGESGPDQVDTTRLQDESTSLRSENEILRSKIASLEGSLNEMTGRLVPKLELGSIAESESEHKRRQSDSREDDTGRYLDDCDVDTARAIAGASDAALVSKLQASEGAAAKLLVQVQELEEETLSLRNHVQELTKQNDEMQREFFGPIHENFQAQVDDLMASNATLHDGIKLKEQLLDEKSNQLKEVSAAETQWRRRYQEVQKMAEELRVQLQRTEKDNHDLQGRLIDLDQECQNMMRRTEGRGFENAALVDMRPKTCDSCAQTLSLADVIRELKAERKARKLKRQLQNGVEDTENDISELDSSLASAPNHQGVLVPNEASKDGDVDELSLANDTLLQHTILKADIQTDEEAFNAADIPAPLATGEQANESSSPESEPPSVSIATKIGETLGGQIKSLQNEIVGYQLMIEKLKKRNQELLDGAGAAMTQDDKEAMEREISALRGQVALLERNNKIFSDRERTDLKQDLEMANRRCNNLQTQVLMLKKAMEYEEMEKLRKQVETMKAEAEEMRQQLRSHEAGESSASESGSESSDGSRKNKKYARLLELEEEADELKQSLEDKDEDLKDKEILVDELQHQLESVKRQHKKEAARLEQENKKREERMKEDVKELEKQIEDCNELIQLKQVTLKHKSEQLEDCEIEIEEFRKQIQKKNQEIDRLKWEIETIQRENASLRNRIENLKQGLTEVSELPTSPLTSYRSIQANHSPQIRSSRSPSPRAQSPSGRQLSDRSGRSAEPLASPGLGQRPGSTRTASSIDDDDVSIATPTSALREGLEDAKQKVHDIGDVLETPRTAPVLRSPNTRQAEKKRVASWGNGSSFNDDPDPAEKPERTSDLSSSSDSSTSTPTRQTAQLWVPHPNVKIVETSSFADSLFSSSTEPGSKKVETSLDRSGSFLPDYRNQSEFPPELGSYQSVAASDAADVTSQVPDGNPKTDAAAKHNQINLTIDLPMHESSRYTDESDGRSLQSDAILGSPDLSKSPSSPDQVGTANERFNDVSMDGELSITTVPSNNATIDETSPTPAKQQSDRVASTPAKSQPILVAAEARELQKSLSQATDHDADVSSSSSDDDSVHEAASGDQKRPSNAKDAAALESSSQRRAPSESDRSRTEDVQALSSSEALAGLQKSPILALKSQSFSQTPDLSQNTDSGSVIPSAVSDLLPDDRPTLIQEVAKAREEARKWFDEVTQSDHEKSVLGRRLKELEGELSRLKNVENNLELLKKQQNAVDKTVRDLELLRAQTDLANRKAEEARERNALLLAHLLDKEKVEMENTMLKENIQSLEQKNAEPRRQSPLKEVQTGNLEQAGGRTSAPSPKTSPNFKTNGAHYRSPTDKQLREVKDSFEYIASNFTRLVLKKHDAELALAPEKAKVSKLKRKCLERDQLLAKLVLKLRKKKSDAHDDANESADDSTASTSGIERILAQADSLIRSDVTESDWSDLDHMKPHKRNGDESNEFLSPPRPSSALLRSLLAKPSPSAPASPSHRIYVAKRDFAPSVKPSEDDGSLPVTHSLLPDIQVLAGDTVVAIGNPDKRQDGKLYQLAEVRGKIGFVPLAHLVPAEQVEGMQAFVQERDRNKRKKSSPSSPDKIVDLYKKLEQAHLAVDNKLNRTRSNPSESSQAYSYKEATSRSVSPPSFSDSTVVRRHQSSPPKQKRQPRGSGRGPSAGGSFLDGQSVTSESTYVSDVSQERSGNGKVGSWPRHTPEKRRRKRTDPQLISPIKVKSTGVDADRVRSSTPVSTSSRETNPKHHRSSSVPSRRSASRESRSTRETTSPPHFVSPSRQRNQTPDLGRRSRGDSPIRLSPSVLSSPKPPTFLVIEKTMGQRSMIISWTPPVLDMISRSNGLPVIGYEISIDCERRIQVSGAYTNKAILGDLDLTRNFLVELRTVSSVGTLSRPAEVVYTPGASYVTSSPDTSVVGTKSVEPASRNSELLTDKNDSQLSSSSIRRAKALYAYDPAVDSPYKSHGDEVKLEQGSQVLVIGSPHADGFCNVQVGRRRGLAPVAFLVSEEEDTDVSSVTSSSTRGKRHSRRHSRSLNFSNRS